MLQTIAQVLGTLGGVTGLATLIFVLAQRRFINAKADKTGVDATAVLSDTAIDLLNEVRTELDAYRSEVAALKEHVTKLEAMIRELGGTPPAFQWRPSRRLRAQEN